MSNDYTNLYGGAPSEPEVAPKPFTLDSSQVDIPQGSTPPPQRPLPPRETYIPRPAPPPVQTIPKKEKKPFSPIPLLLVAGVIFLFLGGVVFLTNTWDVMPNMGRAVTLLSASVIAFGANLLAERVFKLQKTGLAFYLLGCIFLPLSIGGIGVFALFGEWFSYNGDGSMLLWASVMLSVALPTLYGQHRYQNKFLAWVSLAGFCGCWIFLAQFFAEEILVNRSGYPDVAGRITACSLWVLLGILFSLLTEWLKRKKQGTPLEIVSLYVLYPLLVLDLILVTFLTDEAAIATAILMALIAVLFGNVRFSSGTFHGGIFGSLPALLSVGSAILEATPDRIEGKISHLNFEKFWFIPVFAALILMALRFVKHEGISKTYGIAGLVGGLIMVPIGAIALLFGLKNPAFITIMGALLIMSVVFFCIEKKGKLPADAPFMAVHVSLVFVTALLTVEGFGVPYPLLLVVMALLLLAEAFLARRIWPVMAAVAACGAMVAGRIPFIVDGDLYMEIMLAWMFTLGFLVTVIYAHVTGRKLLEKAGAWTLIPFLLYAFMLTLDIWFDHMPIVLLTLTLALTTLLFLLEAFALSSHERTKGTVLYLEIASILFSLIAVVALYDTKDTPFGWGFLLLIMLGIYAVVFTRKRINAAAIPHLLLFYFTAQRMLEKLDADRLTEFGMTNTGTWSIVFQVIGFALLLGLFALMGRFLVPEGFFTMQEKTFRMDWPLLVGVLPIVGAVVVIDWHPMLLFFLFLTLYSLLYIGRLQHRRIPALLASLFFCMTILVHNWEDPFGLFVLWHNWEVRTPQLLLYLLPLHLFIFSLLFILPKVMRPGVHVARFVMYCLTMFCLLLSSMNFGNVADAIILVVFSFAILAGSFFVRRLRWFTLGFAVLVVMTVRLTWSFWTSLHWGIYLFLAGALLIAIASIFELRVRRAAEHPEQPKKSMNPFAAWRW